MILEEYNSMKRQSFFNADNWKTDKMIFFQKQIILI